MEELETLQSHVLRVLADDLRRGAKEAQNSWYTDRMVDSAIEMEALAIEEECATQAPLREKLQFPERRSAPQLLSRRR